MSLLQGKSTVITGAASGIGETTAKTFAEEGASVVAVDIDAENGRETVADIEDAGGEATFVEADVSVEGDAKEMIETAVETYGGLDVLFNNAGIEGPVEKTADHTLEDFERVIDVNLTGTWLGTKYGIEAMLEDGGGSIISTSSIGSKRTIPQYAAYGASKAGINQLMRVVAIEYIDENIRANAIAPGLVRTEMIERVLEDTEEDLMDALDIYEPMPPGIADTADIADAAVFLASDRSKRITGTLLPVEGGYLSEGKHTLPPSE